jgi:hypothetical protein
MHKNIEIALLVVSVLFLLVTIYTTQQREPHRQQFAFGQGQTTEPLVANKTTFRSIFDTFVFSESEGYGIYKERHSNVFKPGDEVIIYVEPVGYTYRTLTDENGTKLYSIEISADMTVTDKNGVDVGGEQDLPLIDVLSHHQNKELNADLSLTGTETLEPGDYILKWTVTDENSGKTFDIVKDFTISQ